MKLAARQYGILARFDEPQQLLTAARQATLAGYRRVDAYSPLPIQGLAEALEFHRTGIARVILIAGLFGAVFGFALQWWISVVAYPLNVGGRPLNSWPSFIPVTFELTILFAALGGVLGMLGLNGLPRPHHPLFAIESFARATQDAFFLAIEAEDPQFDRDETRRFLEQLQPREVIDVPG